MGGSRIFVNGRTLNAREGATLMECLVSSELFLRMDCGGRGRCGKCVVRVASGEWEGLSEPDEAEERNLGSGKLSQGYRLACRARVRGAVSIEIPEESRLAQEVMRKGLPSLLPRTIPEVPAPESATSASWGVAVDIGTTTIAAYLCEMASGTIAASTSVRNPQAVFGEDVVSRVGAVRSEPAVLPRLQQMAASAVNWAVSGLCRQAGIAPEHIIDMVCVGNSIMLHLFLGEDPSSIAVYPYTPRFSDARTLPARDIGVCGETHARLRTLPLISGYLGADIVGAALAADLMNAAPGTMLVDVGTNGEVIFVTEKGLMGTSCATGPAFEGASIRHGMQAVSGAVDSVRFSAESGRLEYGVIRLDENVSVQPAGICGSGVISAVAELLDAGIIRRDGGFDRNCGFPCMRIDGRGIPEVVIVPAEAAASGRAIVLTQADVRAVQLAKGALRAGIDLLCRESGVSRPRKILLAGAFGSFIDRRAALRIGMFPDMPVEEIEVVGNAAGAGAVMALLREEYFERAAEIAAETRVLDLARHAGFQKAFVDSLSF
ncbi:MAG: ASKHA domain-containing protein [Desulfobacteraceae bacterium]|nr:ASKHA domain-containing protein [Desulfobacteraceae bacterium]